jgi:radical SAM protein with 4Fe4S-binding SPASM domain
MCVDRNTKKKHHMNFSLFKKIIKEISVWMRGKSTWLHLNGEPLLYPRIVDAIKYSSEYGVYPRIATNGSLLTRSLSKKLIKAGLYEIVFSIDAVSSSTYKKIKGVDVDLKSIEKKIHQFIKIRNDLDKQFPIIQVQFVETPTNYKEKDEFIKKWKNTSDLVTIKRMSTRCMEIKDKKLIREAFLYHQPHNKRCPCRWLWRAIAIKSDGSVIPCCQDLLGKMILGDVREKSILEIWNSPRYVKLRLDHIKGIYHGICKFCKEWEGYSLREIISNYNVFLRKPNLAQFEFIGSVKLKNEIFNKYYVKTSKRECLVMEKRR